MAARFVGNVPGKLKTFLRRVGNEFRHALPFPRNRGHEHMLVRERELRVVRDDS
jgi:hypothetical protein